MLSQRGTKVVGGGVIMIKVPGIFSGPDPKPHQKHHPSVRLSVIEHK